MKRFLLLLLLVSVVLFATGQADEPLNVFIIPHSHCDPGWLNTFEGYFHDQVNRILTGVTDQLSIDPTKKFIWAEISFFQLWYEQQSQETRDQVNNIVQRGQLEFVAGGWVQNDEANANFDIVIDQVTEGHDFLQRVFGVVPRIAWQIDPFGHSSLTPSLFARMGFEALVINRIHHHLKATFKEHRTMEFLWTGSQSLGNESELFTHVLHTHYSAPSGFDWEEGGTIHINSDNANYRARSLADTLKQRAGAYRTNNLLVPFGDDFKFQNAGLQFSNMDQLIKEINNHKDFGVKIRYATVSEYFDAVVASAKRTDTQFPKYSGDFFPYADNEDSYWTGYYTTRPGLKSHSRGTDSIIRAAEGLYAIGRAVASTSNVTVETDWDQHFSGLRQARRNAALVQHHDGITGTAKQFVANDYRKKLDDARTFSFSTITEMVQILLTDKASPSLSSTLNKFSFDSGKEVYAVIVHNPLGWVRRKYVKVIVTRDDVGVMSHDGVNLDSQILPIIDVATLEPSIAEWELYFLVEIPPLGTKTYFLSKSRSISTNPLPSTYSTYSKNYLSPVPGSKDQMLTESADIRIENEHVSVKFSGLTALIESVSNKDKGIDLVLNQELIDYRTSRSGAYIMRPDAQAPIYNRDTPIKLVYIKGILVSQVCSHFFKAVNQNKPGEGNFESSVCVRVFSTRGITATPNILEVGGFVEVVYSVIGRHNCETAVRFNTNMNTGRIFYTDNGLEIRERKALGSKTESQYFPNLSVAYLQDIAKGVQFSILSRQAMGTHSRDNGMLEHMVHRSLAQDDGRGLSEPNNDNTRIEVMVNLLVQPIETSVRMARRLALALQHQPRVLHTEAEGGPKVWATQYKPYYYPLVSQFPHNIHLLSLKARDSITDDLIFRLVHIYEVGQHESYSQPKEILWRDIFQDFSVASKRERSLAMSLDILTAQNRKPIFPSSTELVQHASGNAPAFVKGASQNTDEEGVFISQAALDDKKKQEEQKQNEGLNNQNPVGRQLKALESSPDEVIFLNPMQIKSFFVQLIPKTETEKQLDRNRPPKPTRKALPTQAKPPAPAYTDKPLPQNPPVTPILSEVSELEMRAFFGLSIVGTGLVILSYVRLRKRGNKLNSKRKGLMEV